MNILVFTYDYPYRKYNNMSFVKQLIEQFAEMGHLCTVISPWPIFRKRGRAAVDVWENKGEGSSVRVLRPNYLTIPHLKIGAFYPSQWLRERAIRKSLCSLKEMPDVIYCHFWNQGLIALPYAQKWHRPIFVASGESDIVSLLDMKKVTEDFKHIVKGVICASGKNKLESVKLGLTSENKCIVLPNAIDNAKFHKIDKIACRKQLNLPQDKFIVCFVGWFIERKGPLRLQEALRMINNDNIGVLYIGEGPQQPKGDNILFKGSVKHDNLKYYLNASDVFILPTLNEGCCNAIVEAMACGLPVVSSDMDFNREILDASNSILINPMNINEIADAINRLFSDKKMTMTLSKGALKRAAELKIDRRASQIIDFINEKIKQ